MSLKKSFLYLCNMETRDITILRFASIMSAYMSRLNVNALGMKSLIWVSYHHSQSAF